MVGGVGSFPEFEGAEKKIEITFKKSDHSSVEFGNSGLQNLRHIDAKRWQEVILDSINCSIISRKQNSRFDAYILSESSMFVYPQKVILKTCGNTTLLKCLKQLLVLACEYSLDPVFVVYSRKNFKYPQNQLYPHRSISEEVSKLNKHFHGGIHTFGPINGDSFVLYTSDMSCPQDRVFDDRKRTIEILMEDLDDDVMAQFYVNRPDYVSAEETLKTSGLGQIIPGAITDVHQFEPCGYSMNGLLEDKFFTIHITPEKQNSFVSFETDVVMDDYRGLVDSVVKTFRPRKFSVFNLAGSDTNLYRMPTNLNVEVGRLGIDSPETLQFKRVYSSTSTFSTNENYFLNYCLYVRPDAPQNCVYTRSVA